MFENMYSSLFYVGSLRQQPASLTKSRYDWRFQRATNLAVTSKTTESQSAGLIETLHLRGLKIETSLFLATRLHFLKPINETKKSWKNRNKRMQATFTTFTWVITEVKGHCLVLHYTSDQIEKVTQAILKVTQFSAFLISLLFFCARIVKWLNLMNLSV